ncbi:MAG: hypothetical protein SLRJCFUN_002446 [Candidatus Fervidibacter sp.]|jgi:hypothetical protein
MAEKGKVETFWQRWQGVRPERNDAILWEERDGTVILTVSRTDWLARFLRWLTARPLRRRIELDEIGSLVWKLCDGRHTVGEIAEELVQRYRLMKREALTSLAEFLTQLRRRGLVRWQEAKEG